MDRIPETELMDDAAQALAYADADFDEPNQNFLDHLEAFVGGEMRGRVLDLGCGPAEIACALAGAHPACEIWALDGSRAMLDCAARNVARLPVTDGRVHLVHGTVQQNPLPAHSFDFVISNSLLHHLDDPLVLWHAVRHYARPGAPVFIVDLKRPRTLEEAARVVNAYASAEPEALKRDFYNSLRAAYELDEVAAQLARAGLGSFEVREISDRHLAVQGLSLEASG